MADVFSKAKRSYVMSRIRSRGNKATELALIKLFRRHKITGWRRQIEIRKAESGKRKAEIQSEAGFYFPAGAARGFCGRLFLARLSETRNPTQNQRRVLAAEIFDEQAARRARNADIAARRLASDSDLGMFAGAESRNLR